MSGFRSIPPDHDERKSLIFMIALKNKDFFQYKQQVKSISFLAQ